MKRYVLIISVLLLIVSSCKKETTENPFDQVETTQNTNPDFADVPAGNFAFLHSRIFSSTCANSGCHDGTFEPEFRSISSAYNSLVNHPVISNDLDNSYEKRVVPGDINQSLLNARLTTILPNSSGMMPLEVDEDSDWNDNSSAYISLIQDWITSGAPDMYGNLPGQGNANLPPSINGLVVLPEGNTTNPYERDPDQVGITPILVDAASLDIWILAEDDQVNPQDLPVTYMKFSDNITALETSNSVSYSSSSTLSALDFSDNNSTFYHKATIDLSAFESGTVLYLRNYLNDGGQTTDVAIPNSGSNNVIISIFTLQII